LTSLLTRADFDVVHAFDYSDVVTQLTHRQPLPDLAIVDLELPSSVSQPGYDGLQVLTMLRRTGIYAVVVSGYIREVIDTIADWPEVCDVVDKLRFADDGFAAYFLAKIDQALALAEANRRTEGKSPEQQRRLSHIPLGQ
jgi:CheY-like chemotaxis protein